MKVLLGVCGGIAAYKAAELTRELQRRGADVQVAMTAGAERFVTPLTFAALSGRQVLSSLWEPTTDASAGVAPEHFDIEHIRVAQETDVVVIAPATANVIAKLAQGLADDLLSTICLATTAPIVIAPAMNVNMWHHPATQANLATLRSRDIQIVSPGSGELACGMVGEGRLAEPTEIATAVLAAAYPIHDLLEETVLVTAGGTREPVDAVRVLGNRSSGRMGLAVAEAALARGAQVLFVTAGADIPSSPRCEAVRVNTAAQMHTAVLERLPRASVVVMAAAVADYCVRNPAQGKRKKSATMTLELTQTPDILAEVVRQRKPKTTVIGFAAETENLLDEGRRKLREKGVDAIFANDVSGADSGFDVDRNAGLLLTHDREIELPTSSKRALAERLLDELPAIRMARAIA